MNTEKYQALRLTVDPEGAHATGLESCDGELVCHAYGTDAGEGVARRIVACVNACAGIPTERLEHMGSLAPLLKEAFAHARGDKAGTEGDA